MKTVIATDGSAPAQLAETVVAKLVGKRVHPATVLHVVPMPLPMFPSVDGFGALPIIDGTPLEWDSIEAAGQKVAEEAIARLKTLGIEAEAQVASGDIASSILDLAEEVNSELIVVGNRGTSAPGKTQVGTVARRMVAYSPCTVLMARRPKEKACEDYMAELGTRKLNVVVAVDGSVGAEHSLEWIAKNSDQVGLVTLVNVRSLVAFPDGYEGMGLDAWIADEPEAAQKVVDTATAKLADCGVEVMTKVRSGKPAHEIIAEAQESGADVVIIGATRHSAIERFLIGSVSFEVAVAATCSVVVVRPNSPAE